MERIKDYKPGSRFILEGKIIKVVDNSQLRLQCRGNCVFDRSSCCLDYCCSDRIFKLSRLNKLIFWKKKINKGDNWWIVKFWTITFFVIVIIYTLIYTATLIIN